MMTLRFPIVMFDWGDTVMIDDDPTSTVPMVEWPSVRVVPGIAVALAGLRRSGRRMALATSASISDEAQIRGALARCGVDDFFSHIFCFKNTGLPKSPAFYRRILAELAVQASSVLMVGDSFEKDVLAANEAGIFGLWFNPHSAESRTGEMYDSFHSMEALLAHFSRIDAG